MIPDQEGLRHFLIDFLLGIVVLAIPVPLIILDIICSVAAVAKSIDLTADISTFGFRDPEGLGVAGGFNGFSGAGRVVDSFPLVDCILDRDSFYYLQ